MSNYNVFKIVIRKSSQVSTSGFHSYKVFLYRGARPVFYFGGFFFMDNGLGYLARLDFFRFFKYVGWGVSWELPEDTSVLEFLFGNVFYLKNLRAGTLRIKKIQ